MHGHKLDHDKSTWYKYCSVQDDTIQYVLQRISVVILDLSVTKMDMRGTQRDTALV